MIRRRQPEDSRIERKIITGMVVSTEYLREIKPIYKSDSLFLPFSKTIASWCLEYFNHYQTAPGRQIQEIYHDKLKLDLDNTEAKLIEEFLSGLSDEYENQELFNVSYLLDQTLEHFRLQSLKAINDRLKQAIDNNLVDDGEAIIKDYHRIARPEVIGINPFSDEGLSLVWDKRDKDILFKLPGDLGDRLGYFEREQLVGVLGEQGAGKSFWLQFIAQCSVRAGLNTLIFTFELSKRQYINRILHNITALPKESGNILLPVFDCARNQDNSCNRKIRVCEVGLQDKEGNLPDKEDTPKRYKPCTECRETKNFEQTVWYYTERRRRRSETSDAKQIKTENNLLRGKKLIVLQYPSKTKKVSDLKPILYNLEHYQNFNPDVIIIDFADKMLPESKGDFRLQLGEMWELLKSLAQERHCAVFTASQSNTLRTGKRIGQGSWAEDISKAGSIDDGFAIYQTAEQKEDGILEVTQLKKRDDEFSTLRRITVLENRQIGRVYLDSYYER
jgi:replicative DNA helicase